MVEERIPAGWYPDPSGLPQLRWWDNHKWTEFVSDSQLEQQVEVETVEPVLAEPVNVEPVHVEPTLAEPVHVEPTLAEPVHVEPAYVEPAYVEPEQVEPIALVEPEPAALPRSEASWTDLIPEPARTEPDPLDALFAASATSPVGVGTGETVGEAVMRALQTA